jgi:hypothetical protein
MDDSLIDQAIARRFKILSNNWHQRALQGARAGQVMGDSGLANPESLRGSKGVHC